MNTLLMDIKRFAIHDGPGIRTTLFLKGCSLRCIWCHNPEGISPAPELAYYRHKCISCGECVRVCPNKAHSCTSEGHKFDRSLCRSCGECAESCLGEALKLFGTPITVEEALSLALEDREFYGTTGGVTLSGGEPLLHADFVGELLSRLKAESIHTAVDTCGFVPWSAFEKVLPYTDMFLYDVKHIDSEAHRRLTGQGNELIIENLRRLSATSKRIELRMPLVPGCNASEETLRGIGELLGSLNIERMKLLPYHDLARSKYAALGKTDTMPRVAYPSEEQLAWAAELLRSYGVNAD